MVTFPVHYSILLETLEYEIGPSGGQQLGAKELSTTKDSARMRSIASCLTIAISVLVASGLAVYLNALDAPFIYDDLDLIVQNTDIRQLWPPIWMADTTAWYSSVNHRPVVAFSLALNYYLGGLEVRGYHLFNLLVHLLAALALFGVVRRTLIIGGLVNIPAERACMLATVSSLIWLVHPIQSQVINYTLQRSESLMGFFYLITLYCFLRGRDKGSGWHALSIGACVLGMASKESMVTAPVVVLVFDSIFLSGSLLVALRRRSIYYSGLFATWAVVVLLLWTDPHRGAAGFSSGITAWEYLINQIPTIVNYVYLCFWPHRLLLDYGWPDPNLRIFDVIPDIVQVLALLAATIVALVKVPKFGFLFAWFFLTLSPTSSLVPIVNEVAAERRIYLPLAGIVLVTVFGIYLMLDRFSHGPTRLWLRRAAGLAAIGVVAALGVKTVLRNVDYHSRLSIWKSVLSLAPANARAHNNLGQAYAAEGKLQRAVSHYRRAVEIRPSYAQASNNLGNALVATGATDQAIASYRKALKIKPDYTKAAYNLGNALKSASKTREAVEEYRRALAISPDFVAARNNLATGLYALGRVEAAIEQYEIILTRLDTDPLVHSNYGIALQAKGELNAAAAHFRRALELDPSSTQVRVNLNNLRHQLDGRRP